MPRILVVEDDPHISDVVEFLLREENHRVDRATDGTCGWQRCESSAYDLVILDLGLPGVPGLELFRRIRERDAEQPVIMLTARGEEEDRVRGLSLGADDYISKPFSNPELVARVRNLLRRCPPRVGRMVRGPFLLDAEIPLVEVSGRPVELARHEFQLLRTLLERPARTFTRDQLLDRMYPDHVEVTDRAVDQTVTRLRRKLSTAGAPVDSIETVYGLGYRLKPGIAEAAS